jgi:uncharacterized coiled-coil DUF342 family protein
MQGNKEQYQELINIYEENPNYRIEIPELKNNLINVSSTLNNINKEIGSVLESTRVKC